MTKPPALGRQQQLDSIDEAIKQVRQSANARAQPAALRSKPRLGALQLADLALSRTESIAQRLSSLFRLAHMLSRRSDLPRQVAVELFDAADLPSGGGLFAPGTARLVAHGARFQLMAVPLLRDALEVAECGVEFRLLEGELHVCAVRALALLDGICLPPTQLDGLRLGFVAPQDIKRLCGHRRQFALRVEPLRLAANERCKHLLLRCGRGGCPGFGVVSLVPQALVEKGTQLRDNRPAKLITVAGKALRTGARPLGLGHP